MTNNISPEFLVNITEMQMLDYIYSLSPQIITIPNSLIIHSNYTIDKKDSMRDLNIILQKVNLSLFYSTSILTVEENGLIENIGDPSNFNAQSEVGSDFLYYITNRSNDVDSQTLIEKAKSALFFLNEDPFVVSWDITFEKKELDEYTYILSIQTTKDKYDFLIDLIQKRITT